MYMEHFNIYLAGVFDSDGSISVIKRLRQSTSRGYQYRELLQVSWKLEPGTERLAREIKDRFGGSVSISTKTGFGKEIQVVKYSCEGNIAESLLMAITPFMRLKKPQAELALEMRNIKSRNHGVGRPKSNESWNREDIIYKKMQKQKARGRV